MKELRLNLDVLRTWGWPSARAVSHTSQAVRNVLSGKPFSRRGFMGVGVAVLGASATPRAAGGAALGRFDIVGDSKRLAFLMDGHEKWVIDTEQFAGNPVLRFKKTKNQIALALRNARFPGTTLPADFDSEIRPALIGWNMKLRLLAGGFQGEVPLGRWLMGEIPMRSRIRRETEICRLPQGAGLSIPSPADSEFLPNWVLRFDGPRAAVLSNLGSAPVYSD